MNGLQIMLDQVVATYKKLDQSLNKGLIIQYSTHDMLALLRLLSETHEILKTKKMKKEAQMVNQAIVRCSPAYAEGYFKPRKPITNHERHS